MSNSERNPYIGPRTFQRDEGHLFFGREREARDLLRLVVSEQMVLFYAQSGAGKSSLINTRLIPELESRGIEVLPTGRVSGDLPPNLEVENIFIFNLMRNLLQYEMDPIVLANLSLVDFLSSLVCEQDIFYFREAPPAENEENEDVEEENLPSPTRRVLIIDQFEELFSTHPEEWKKRDNFFRQLAQAIRDNPYLWVVLVMREDYIATMDPYAYLLPGGLRVRYYMQRLGREAALKAIKTPVQSIRPYAPGVAERLVDDLCGIKVTKPDGSIDVQPGQYVEPVQLQVICYNLWENLSEGTEITDEDIEEVGDVNTSLGNYYAARVKAVADAKKVNERKIREWFTEKLIAPGGIRGMVMQKSNSADGGLNDNVIQALQSDLVRAEKRSGATWYELTHDRLVEPIIENNREWFNLNLSPLQRQAALWRDQGRADSWLLKDQALEDVAQWAKDHPDEMTAIEAEFLEVCRRNQAHEDRIRQMQHRELEMAKNLAEEQTKSAEQARRIAEEQERYAREQEQNATRQRSLTRRAFALLGVAILFVGIAVFAWINAQASAAEAADQANLAATREAEAIAAKAEANDLAYSASARELASAAKSNLDREPELAFLLSLEAYKASTNVKDQNVPEAQSALFNSMQRALRLRGFLTTSEEPAEEFRYSPDGQSIAILKENGLSLWDVSTNELREVHSSIPGSEAINKFTSGDKFLFSPDGSRLVYLTRQGLNVWDINNKTDLTTEPINGHEGAVKQIQLTGTEGINFFTLGDNGEATLWAMTADTDEPVRVERSYDGDSVILSPLGDKIAILDNRAGTITVQSLLDSADEPIVSTQEPNTVTSLAFNPTSDTLAMSLNNGSITLWNLLDNTERNISTQQVVSIVSLTFNSTGEYITYTANGNAWRLDPLNPPTPNNPANSLGVILAESENGDKLVLGEASTSTGQPQFKLWDVAPNQQLGTQRGGDVPTFSPDSKYLAVFNKEDRTITVLNSSKPNDAGLFTINTDLTVQFMSFSKDGNYLAIGAGDGMVEIWEIAKNILLYTDELPSGSLSSFALSDSQLFILGSNAGKLRVVHLNPEETIDMETGYTGKILSFNFNEQENLFYSVAQDGILFMDPSTLEPQGDVIPGSPLTGEPLQFFHSTDRLVLATRISDETHLWDVKSNKRLGTPLKGNYQQFSQERQFLVLTEEVTGEAGKSTTLTLVEIATGKAISDPIPGDYVYFSPDDRLAAVTNSTENKTTLWNTSEKIQVGEVDGLNPQFAPRHEILATFNDGTYLFWDTSTAEQIELDEPIQGQSIVFSSDGRIFAVTTSTPPSQKITLWKTETMEKIGSPIPGSIYKFGLGADEQSMLVQNTIYTLWDIETANFVGGPIDQSALYTSPQNNFITYTSYYASYLWNIKKNKQVATLCESSFTGCSQQAPQFSPDPEERLLAWKNNDGTLTLWDTATGKQIGSPIRGQSGIGNVLFNPPGSKTRNEIVFSPLEYSSFAMFNSDGSISLWDTHAPPSIPGTRIEIEDMPESINRSAVTEDGGSLALSTNDGIKIFEKINDDTYDAQTVLPNAHIKEAYDVYMNSDGTILVAANYGGSLSFWNKNTGLELSIRETFHTLSPDGKVLVSSSNSNFYTLRHTDTGEMFGNPLIGTWLQFSPDGKYIILQNLSYSEMSIVEAATGTRVGDPLAGSFHGFGPDGKTMVLNNGSSFILYDFEDQSSRTLGVYNFNSPRFSPDSRFMVTIANDGTLTIWEVETGSPTGTINGFAGEFRGFSPDNRLMYLYSYEKSGLILLERPVSRNITKSEIDKVLNERVIIPGYSLTFSDDGTLAVVSNYWSGSASTLWNVKDAKAPVQIGPVPGSFQGFGNSGALLVTTAAGSGGSSIRFIRVDDFSEVDEYTYPGSLNRVFLSRNGTHVAAAGNAGIELLDITDLEQDPVSFKDRSGIPQQLLFSPDGSLLGTLGSDGLLLWDVKSQELVGQVPGRISNYRFTQNRTSITYIDQNRNVFRMSVEQAAKQSELETSQPVLSDVCSNSLSPSGTSVVKLNNRKLQIWDINTLEKIDLPGDQIEFCPTYMAFSPNERSFAYSESSRIHVFSEMDGKAFNKNFVLIGKTEDTPPYYDLAFVTSVSGQNLLLTRAGGGRIFLWNIQKRTQVAASDLSSEPTVFADSQMLIYLRPENQFVSINFLQDEWTKSLEGWQKSLCEKVRPMLSEAEWALYFSGEFSNYEETGTCP